MDGQVNAINIPPTGWLFLAPKCSESLGGSFVRLWKRQHSKSNPHVKIHIQTIFGLFWCKSYCNSSGVWTDAQKDCPWFSRKCTCVCDDTNLCFVPIFAGLAKEVEIQLKNPKSRSNIEEGTTVNLKCNVDGNPEPSVEWFKNKLRFAFLLASQRFFFFF